MISYDDIKSGKVAVPVARVDANSIPSLIDRASKRLAEAKTSAEVLEAKAAAELALHYAKVTKAANDSHADCLRIITRAEIRMASEIDRGQETGEVAKRGGDRVSNAPQRGNASTMQELGVPSQRVAEWRKVAEAGEDVVEQAIAEVLADGRAPTKADVQKAAGISKKKTHVDDEEQQYNDLQNAWNCAIRPARVRFMRANDLMEQPTVETHDAEACKPNSSAVEVGATNSPDGAHEKHLTATCHRDDDAAGQSGEVDAVDPVVLIQAHPEVPPEMASEAGRFESGSLTEIMVKPQVQVLPGTPIEGAKGGPTGMGRSDSVERHAPNSNPQPTTPPEADKAEAAPPSVSAAPFNNPRCQKPETCHLAHSRNECFECNVAWSKRPKDEQVRLWAEAVQAARAA